MWLLTLWEPPGLGCPDPLPENLVGLVAGCSLKNRESFITNSNSIKIQYFFYSDNWQNLTKTVDWRIRLIQKDPSSVHFMSFGSDWSH